MNPFAIARLFHRSPRGIWLAVALAACLTLSNCASPASSTDGDTPVDAEFEEKVLQVIRDNPQVIIEAANAYRQQQQAEAQEAQDAVAREVLKDPSGAIGESPTKGAEDRNIVLFEFSDFQCPYCAAALEALDPFMERHGDEVTLVYKHLPLTQIHPEALPSAKASWAAQQQGQFWPYHDALFAAQDRLGEDLYVEIAEDLDLDMEQFNRDRNSAAAEQAIADDMALVQRIGVNSTPTFFMNGRRVDLSEDKAFEKVLEEIKAE